MTGAIGEAMMAVLPKINTEPFSKAPKFLSIVDKLLITCSASVAVYGLEVDTFSKSQVSYAGKYVDGHGYRHPTTEVNRPTCNAG